MSAESGTDAGRIASLEATIEHLQRRQDSSDESTRREAEQHRIRRQLEREAMAPTDLISQIELALLREAAQAVDHRDWERVEGMLRVRNLLPGR